MRTKSADLSTDRRGRLEDALRRPHTWRITGIDAFWLEDQSGSRMTTEFSETGPAYDAVLAAVRRGVAPDDIVLVGRTPRGRRSVLGDGLDLLDVAEAHEGIPARPRVPRG